jgi:hypothetical protein
MKMEHALEQKVNVKLWVKLQKSTTFQSPIHGVEIKELPWAKEATNVKVQYQNNVDLIF